MAAVAHDVAAFWLKGQDARLNFPNSVGQLPMPASSKPNDIRSAALEAALEVKLRQNPSRAEAMSGYPALQRVGSGCGSGSGYNFCADEWGLDSPKMWRELAEAMLIAPPQAYGYEANEAEFFEPLPLWDSLV